VRESGLHMLRVYIMELVLDCSIQPPVCSLALFASYTGTEIGCGLIRGLGFIVSAYSTEGNRGRYIAWFWASGSLGAAISASKYRPL
jgi:hypothetical protein